MNRVIHASNLNRTFRHGHEQTIALCDVALSIPPASMTVFVGASGSGKSTLLALIGLLDRPDTTSHLEIAGRCALTMSSHDMAEARSELIGFLFQDAKLIERMSVVENVALPLAYRGIDRKTRETRALNWLERVGLASRARLSPCKLSGGERQRAALARAMIAEPKILICDEPTAALDEGRASELNALLRDVASGGTAVLIATHDPAVIERADRAYLLDRGRLAQVHGSEALRERGLQNMAAVWSHRQSAGGV
ncbi:MULTISPECIES: ABC transporter ATP-binding protein [Hyphobacterium]|uniref:ABC transporter ATP-binding protein n=1 Tax=Hyphobacterium vulgare TaxID=1736751 RepID=A0ABV6ZZK5_9PROT